MTPSSHSRRVAESRLSRILPSCFDHRATRFKAGPALGCPGCWTIATTTFNPNHVQRLQAPQIDAHRGERRRFGERGRDEANVKDSHLLW